MVFADSVNLARRLSSRNEHDLVQEKIATSKHSITECKALASKVGSVQELPIECQQHKDVVASVKQSPDQTDLSIAFQGMGSAAAASIKARKTGQQNYAQIQRRYTNTKRFNKD